MRVRCIRVDGGMYLMLEEEEGAWWVAVDTGTRCVV